MADDIAATLAAIRERWMSRIKNAPGLGADPTDFPRLLAAVEAVLKLADEACELEVRGVRLDWWDLSPSRLREAVAAELAAEESDVPRT